MPDHKFHLTRAGYRYLCLIQWVIFLVHRYGGVVVESLGRKHLSQLAPLPTALLDLGALVLEPYLDLVLVQPQFIGQVLPPLLGEVAVLLKLPLQSRELLRAESRSRPLLGRG